MAVVESSVARRQMNQAIMVGLRFVHIVSGVFWAGAVFLMVGFIFPAVRASGPQAGRFMEEVARRRAWRRRCKSLRRCCWWR
jgi:hypothetical protein